VAALVRPKRLPIKEAPRRANRDAIEIRLQVNKQIVCVSHCTHETYRNHKWRKARAGADCRLSGNWSSPTVTSSQFLLGGKAQRRCRTPRREYSGKSVTVALLFSVAWGLRGHCHSSCIRFHHMFFELGRESGHSCAACAPLKPKNWNPTRWVVDHRLRR